MSGRKLPESARWAKDRRHAPRASLRARACEEAARQASAAPSASPPPQTETLIRSELPVKAGAVVVAESFRVKAASESFRNTTEALGAGAAGTSAPCPFPAAVCREADEYGLSYYRDMVTTDEGLYSTCLPRHCAREGDIVAQYVREAGLGSAPESIIDATANVGGGVINLLRRFRGASASCVELNPVNAAALRYNLEVAGVAPAARVSCGDVCALLEAGGLGYHDMAYVDPPWGGPGSGRRLIDELFLNRANGARTPLAEVMWRLLAVVPLVVLRLPPRFNARRLVEQVGPAAWQKTPVDTGRIEYVLCAVRRPLIARVARFCRAKLDLARLSYAAIFRDEPIPPAALGFKPGATRGARAGRGRAAARLNEFMCLLERAAGEAEAAEAAPPAPPALLKPGGAHVWFGHFALEAPAPTRLGAFQVLLGRAVQTPPEEAPPLPPDVRSYVDIGAGDATISVAIARRLGVGLTAVDPAPPPPGATPAHSTLAGAHPVYYLAGPGQNTYVQAEFAAVCEELGAGGARAQLITASMSLHHTGGGLDATLRGVHGLLEPGGLFFVREHDCAPGSEDAAFLSIVHQLYRLAEAEGAPASRSWADVNDDDAPAGATPAGGIRSELPTETYKTLEGWCEYIEDFGFETVAAVKSDDMFGSFLVCYRSKRPARPEAAGTVETGDGF